MRCKLRAIPSRCRPLAFLVLGGPVTTKVPGCIRLRDGWMLVCEIRKR